MKVLFAFIFVDDVDLVDAVIETLILRFDVWNFGKFGVVDLEIDLLQHKLKVAPDEGLVGQTKETLVVLSQKLKEDFVHFLVFAKGWEHVETEHLILKLAKLDQRVGPNADLDIADD